MVNHQLNYNADSAVFASKTLNEYAIANKDATQLFKSSYLRGKSLELAGENDSALIYYNKMRHFAFQLNDTNKILRSYNALGTIFLEIGSNDSVAYFYRKGIELATRVKDTIQLANFLTNIGIYYEQCNKFDSAMISYTKGAMFYEKGGDSIEMALLYRNLGNLFLQLDLPLKSIVEYSKAIAINQQLKKILEVGLDYNNLALAYKYINNDSVFLYFQKATLIFSESGSVSNIIMVKYNYANYLKRLGKTNESEKLYQEVLNISIRNNILMGRIYSLCMLAKIQVIENNLQNANKYFDEALALAKKNKLTKDMLRLYFDIFESNLMLNNSKVAMNYFTLWNQLNDSLQTSNQKETIIKYNTLYETEKKELAIKLLEIENERNRLKSKYLLIIFIIAMIGALAIFYAFWIRSKHAKQKLLIAEQKQNAQELEIHNKDLLLLSNEQKAILDKQEIAANQKLLVSKMLLLSHHSEFLSETLMKLQDLNQMLGSEEQQDSLIEILNSIKNQVKPKRWDDFQQQYMKSHEDFFTKLNQLHPNLTAGDHRLCAMLRMNLSIKEISELTMQTPRAIEMARFRLRNKFGLSREDNLTSYLSKF
jgi:tetratricopeptide (TPR) repeat protein